MQRRNKQYLGRIVFIHGVRWSDKNKSMYRLATAFKEAGFCIIIPKYGFVPAMVMGLFSWLDNRIAESMSAFIYDDDIIVGHSNGATLAYLISKRRKIKGAILINAALGVNELPDAEFVDVYFNHGDLVAQASAAFPFSPWGAMGGLGYLGPRKDGVTNIDEGHPPESFLPALHGHSDIFSYGKLRPWARYIAGRCLNALKVK